MKNYKKCLLAFALAAVTASPVAMLASPTFAADEVVDDGNLHKGGSATPNSSGSIVSFPKESDKTNIVVKGVETKSTIIAYQILKGDYVTFKGSENNDSGGLKNFVATADFNNADGTPIITNPSAGISAAQANEIAALLLANDSTYSVPTITDWTENPTGTYTTDQATAGSWIIIVTDKSDGVKVYNPMVASVNYKESENSTGQKTYELIGTTITEKSSSPSLDKKIAEFDDEPDETSDGAAFGKGERIKFEIATTIPSYDTSVYTSPQFNIKDEFSDGLSFYKEKNNEIKVEVHVNGELKTPSNTDSNKDTGEEINYKIEINDNDASKDSTKPNLSIEFEEWFIKKHIGQSVVITYSAQISENNSNFDGTHNIATLEYTNDPTPESDLKPLTDRTYQYTFAIDGNVGGEHPWISQDLVKVNEKYNPKTNTGITEDGRLNDAKFGLWEKETFEAWENAVKTNPSATLSAPIRTTISGDTNGDGKVVYPADGGTVNPELHDDPKLKGILNFKGLDAGEYVVKEIEAPAGYSLNDEKINVKISAQYYSEAEANHPDIYAGMLKNYTISVNNNEKQNTYTIENIGTETEIVKTGSDSDHYEGWKINDDGDYVVDPDSSYWNNHAYPVQNTKIAELPSTGGAGTYLFTIGGVVVMGAAGLMILRKRTSKS